MAARQKRDINVAVREPRLYCDIHVAKFSTYHYSGCIYADGSSSRDDINISVRVAARQKRDIYVAVREPRINKYPGNLDKNSGNAIIVGGDRRVAPIHDTLAADSGN